MSLNGEIEESLTELLREEPRGLEALLSAEWHRRLTGRNDGSLISGSSAGDPTLLEEPSRRSKGGILPEALALWLGRKHLIYAYMIENTGIYEIFRRVLFELFHGEKLGRPRNDDVHKWLQSTEQLFFRELPSFTVGAVTSYVRPDLLASRRNAYWRFFGLDLNHGTESGQAYPYVKPAAANTEFVSVFEELLRESWVAISNRRNTSGANPSDRSKIEDLLDTLGGMLTTRRMGGNLEREEFVFTTTLAWFHISVLFNSSIVDSLNAVATRPEQVLFSIAQKVGVPAHGLSKSYFEIANPISDLLIEIEAHGAALASDITETDPNPITPVQNTLNKVITHWTAITGRDMKAGKVVAA